MEEWITDDDDLWGTDSEFIWIPQDIDGLLTFVAINKKYFYETTSQEYTFESKEKVYQFNSKKRKYFFTTKS